MSFEVLVATDGSPQARAAVAVAAAFPWPRDTRLHAVVARTDLIVPEWPAPAQAAVDRRLREVVRAARRALVRRWPDADVLLVDQPPVPAILDRARQVGAQVIVVGSRGHSALGRFLLGSVSRAVVRQADCAVLVVKGRARAVRDVVLGFDGSAHAARAAELLTRLPPPAGGRVTVVRVVEPVRLPSMGLLPGAVRRTVARQAAEVRAQRLADARREVAAVTQELKGAGWRVQPVLGPGVPLTALLQTVAASRADCLTMGARGVEGVERLLLGSVAEGALSRASVPVLVVK